jgi:WD40 repeat protein
MFLMLLSTSPRIRKWSGGAGRAGGIIFFMPAVNVFISYGRRDDPEFVAKLVGRLSAAKDVVELVWWDQTSMESRGQTFLQVIRDNIAILDRFLLVVGPHAAGSVYVQHEWKHAVEFGKVVIPLLRAAGQELVPNEFQALNAIDFRGPFDAAFQKLMDALRQPVANMGEFLTSVPALPPNFLLREHDLANLKALVLKDVLEPVLVSPLQRITVIPAVPGSGKTTLATAFVRSAEVRRAFPNGILWLGYPLHRDQDMLDRERVLLDLLNRTGRAIDNSWVTHTDRAAAQDTLQRRLKDLILLLVLDNADDATDIEPFRRSMGDRCKVLVTTRNQKLAEVLAAQELELELWREGPWKELLAAWSGSMPEQLPEAAATVAARSDYLPLALAVSGFNASQTGWDILAHELEENGQKWLEADIPGYYKSLFAAFDSSVSRLGTDERARYLDMAAFIKGAAIPESAILALWKQTSALAGFRAIRLIGDLAARSLFTAEGKPPGRVIRMLDAQADYVRWNCENVDELQATLLKAYAAQAPDGWPSGPNDGYFFQSLGAHLRAAKRGAEFEQLILGFRWLAVKLEKCGPDSLLDDLSVVSVSHANEAIRDAIILSDDAIRADPSLLAGQLTARLLGSSKGGIHQLLENARRLVTMSWLRPMVVSLTNPGRLSRYLTGHDWVLMAMSLSEDGRLLLSTASETILVWNTATWKQERSIEVPRTERSDLVWSLAITPDNRHVLGLLGMFETDLAWWNVETGRLERKLRIPSPGFKTRLAVTGNGRVFAAGAQLIEIRTETGQRDRSTWAISPIHDGTSGVIAARGNTLAFSLADGSLMTLDCVTDRTKPETIAQLAQPATSLAIERQEKFIVAGSRDGRAHVIFRDGSRTRFEWQAHQDEICAVAVAGEPTWVFTSSKDGTFRVWDPTGGAEQLCIERHWRNTNPAHLAVTPDGRYAVDSMFNLLRIWDLCANAEPGIQPEHSGPVSRVAVTPDGRFAFSAGLSIRKWDIAARRCLASFSPANAFQDLALTADGKQVLARQTDGTLRMWDAESGNEQRALKKDGALGGFAATPDGRQCIWASRSQLQRWSLEDDRLLSQNEAGWGRISQIVAMPGFAVAACQDQTVRIWNFASGELTPLKGHTGIVEAVAVSSDGRYAISGCDDRTIRVWDLALRREEFRIPVRESEGHTHWIRSIAVSRDGRFIVSGGFDKRIIVWDWRKRERVAVFMGDSMIQCCTFAPDNRTVLAGEMSGWIHFLRLENVPGG